MKRLLSLAIPLLLWILAIQAQGSQGDAQFGDGSGFAVGPYLLEITDEEATVAFHLRKPMQAAVHVHVSGRVQTFLSDQARLAHFIRISGLAPGRTYRYEVVCEDGTIRTPAGDPGYQFRTAARPGESFTFAVYGDPRPGDTGTHRHYREVISQVILSEPSFCLVLGDMVDQGHRREQWEDFFRIGSGVLRRAALYPVVGDNDYALGRGLYADYFPRLRRGYYHFNWGSVHLFGMHVWDARGMQPASSMDADSAQVKWLEAELSREEVQNAPFRVVFLHDPVYISRGRSSKILQDVWGPIFHKYKVDLVFASWHMYERSQYHGVTYVISGGAGAELIWMKKDRSFPSQAEARRHHYCRVDVSAGAMTVRAISSDGTVLDTFTLVPKGSNVRTSNTISDAARRLRREIIFNGGAVSSEIPVHLFSYDCSYCRKLLHHDFSKWARENGVSIRVFFYDLAKAGAYNLFMAAGADFGRQGADIPTLFVGRSVLGGEGEITKGFPSELRRFRQNTERYMDRMFVPFGRAHDIRSMKENEFSRLNLGVV
ncbi:MAG: metallophosphoesterase, partial [Deltaproteobacteria bacterium]